MPRPFKEHDRCPCGGTLERVGTRLECQCGLTSDNLTDWLGSRLDADNSISNVAPPFGKAYEAFDEEFRRWSIAEEACQTGLYTILRQRDGAGAVACTIPLPHHETIMCLRHMRQEAALAAAFHAFAKAQPLQEMIDDAIQLEGDLEKYEVAVARAYILAGIPFRSTLRGTPS